MNKSYSRRSNSLQARRVPSRPHSSHIRSGNDKNSPYTQLNSSQTASYLSKLDRITKEQYRQEQTGRRMWQYNRKLLSNSFVSNPITHLPQYEFRGSQPTPVTEKSLDLSAFTDKSEASATPSAGRTHRTSPQFHSKCRLNPTNFTENSTKNPLDFLKYSGSMLGIGQNPTKITSSPAPSVFNPLYTRPIFKGMGYTHSRIF